MTEFCKLLQCNLLFEVFYFMSRNFRLFFEKKFDQNGQTGRIGISVVHKSRKVIVLFAVSVLEQILFYSSLKYVFTVPLG